MEKYETLGVVGEGSYGLVLRCRHRESGTLVAIKRFLETEDDAAVRKMALREIRMLKKLRHENLVSMLEVFRRKRRFYLVFEFMDHTLLEELEERAACSASGGLGEATVRRHAFQIIRGLDFCHANSIVHRDVKPENVLVSRLGVVKLCDFGFARLVASPGETYTDYVATRWYRAPELLVGDTHYGREVDVWAVGCLMAEMMTGNPLFAGDSDIDQLFLITKALGKLSPRHQQLVARNPMFKGMRVNSAAHGSGDSLYDMFSTWPRLALDMTAACLRLDPILRPATTELLQHLYFTADNFPAVFLPELRARIQQECMANPLLSRRLSNTANSARGRDLPLQQQQQAELEERILLPSTVSTKHNENTRVGSGPRWKVQLMGPDAPIPERRGGEHLKPGPRRREEWMEENSRGGGVIPAAAKLSPTRAPSRLAAHLFIRSSQPLQPHPPPQQQAGEQNEFQQGPLSPSDPSLLSQSINHLHVLHPAINNLSFSTAHAHTRLGEALKRSPLQGAQGRLKERNVAAPPLTVTSRSHARRLGERGIGLQTCESIDRDTPPPPPPLAWAAAASVAASRRLAPMRHRGSLMPGTAPDDFSLPNLPGATGSPTKGLKKKEKLSTNLMSMEPFPSPEKPSAGGGVGHKRNTSALDRELS